jgi:hypothetical protein
MYAVGTNAATAAAAAAGCLRREEAAASNAMAATQLRGQGANEKLLVGMYEALQVLNHSDQLGLSDEHLPDLDDLLFGDDDGADLDDEALQAIVDKIMGASAPGVAQVGVPAAVQTPQTVEQQSRQEEEHLAPRARDWREKRSKIKGVATFEAAYSKNVPQPRSPQLPVAAVH